MGKFSWNKRTSIAPSSSNRRDGIVKHLAAVDVADLGRSSKELKELNLNPSPALVRSSSSSKKGSDIDDGKCLNKAEENCSTELKNVGSKEVDKLASSLIHSHIASSRKETPWDQEFSSMSSCRSDGDPSLVKRPKPLMAPGGEDEDEDELPPLLRNPHVAEFDIVDDFSSTDELSPGPLSRPAQQAGDENDDFLASTSRQDSSVNRRRRGQNSSFSASLPSEIKGVVADSIPLVKYSRNPYEDFRLSMLEMIQEKRLFVWSDLEELLFCYLSLNSPEHHDVIKQSFADVWKELGLAPPAED